MISQQQFQQMQTLISRYNLWQEELRVPPIADDEAVSYEQYMELAQWAWEILYPVFENCSFIFDGEQMIADIRRIALAFRHVKTDGVPVYIPTADQMCMGFYLPESLANDLRAIFAPVEEALNLPLAQRLWR